jgi:hypothetical protein
MVHPHAFLILEFGKIAITFKVFHNQFEQRLSTFSALLNTSEERAGKFLQKGVFFVTKLLLPK